MNRRRPLSLTAERIALATLLLLTFGLRAYKADQPIVENYVGRQVPTAMVARNLERGSGFLRPRLDTGPFPNLFLVEPPLYEEVVVEFRRLFLLRLDPAGRLISALGMTLGAWGLFGLTRRREGPAIALLSVAAFALFPVTIRYGRAFQPDALMLGTLLAGLRCWDERESSGDAGWSVMGWCLLATALALKVIAAYIFLPLCLAVIRPPKRWKIALALSTLLPALLWYVHARQLLATSSGSRASADSAAIWLSVLIPTALIRGETYRTVARFLFVRAFTPLGPPLNWVGWWRGATDRLWTTWYASVALMLVALAAKIHHEYYWLALAPLLAVGLGRGLVGLWGMGRWGRPSAVVAGIVFVGFSVVQSASTFRTPAEWSHLSEATIAVRTLVPPDALLIAPEALLYASDRRGARLELDPKSARRAAGEWGAVLPESDDPLSLVDVYRSHGLTYLADTGAADDPARLALRDALRAKHLVLVDRPGVLIAALTPAKGADHGRR